MLWLCFKLPYYLFGNTRDTSVMHEKAKFVCFIYMQPQKVKFKSVQINTKQVSYNLRVIQVLANPVHMLGCDFESEIITGVVAEVWGFEMKQLK